MKWRSSHGGLSLRIHLVCMHRLGPKCMNSFSILKSYVIAIYSLQTLLLVGNKVFLPRNKSINCQLAMYIQIVHSCSSSTGTVPLQLYIAKWKKSFKTFGFYTYQGSLIANKYRGGILVITIQAGMLLRVEFLNQIPYSHN